MTTVSLDQIVRNLIVKRRYTIHIYLDFLVYAVECLRTLSMDDLKVINTMELAVDPNTNSIDLPDDYLDYVQVGIRSGQNTKPLVETDKINPLVARTADFTPTSYGAIGTNDSNIIYYGAIYPYYFNTVVWNNYGEFTGRQFGYNSYNDDTFSVFPERNQIQLTERLSVSHIVLRYISDGMNSDSATQITPYAFQTISNYIMWQMKENSRTYSDSESERARQLYINERLILRGRLSDLTTERLKRSLQKAVYGSPKSL